MADATDNVMGLALCRKRFCQRTVSGLLVSFMIHAAMLFGTVVRPFQSSLDICR